MTAVPVAGIPGLSGQCPSSFTCLSLMAVSLETEIPCGGGSPQRERDTEQGHGVVDLRKYKTFCPPADVFLKNT